MADLIHPALRDIEVVADGYTGRFKDLHFIVSTCREQDGREWLHASVSRRDHKMPSYDDLAALKRLCVGEHRTALQVFPSTERHINFAGEHGIEVLHLWCCLDGDVTPDFARGGNMI
jgi:hypothetical protein